MRKAVLCSFAISIASGCGFSTAYTMDGTGKVSQIPVPQHISQVDSIVPLGGPEETYRFLMLRCAGAESESNERSRRLFGARLIFQMFGAALGTISTILVSVNEVHDGGSLSADTRNNLKIGAAITGGGAVLSAAVLAFSNFDNRIEASRRLLQQVRRTRDSVRARWWLPDSNKGALLSELAQACGGEPLEERPLRQLPAPEKPAAGTEEPPPAPLSVTPIPAK